MNTQGDPSFDVSFSLIPGDRTVPKRFRRRMDRSFFVTGIASDPALVHGDQAAYRRWRRKSAREDENAALPMPNAVDVASRAFGSDLTRTEMQWMARMLNAARAGVLDLSWAKMQAYAKKTKQVVVIVVAPDGLRLQVPLSEELLSVEGAASVAPELSRLLAIAATEAHRA